MTTMVDVKEADRDYILKENPHAKKIIELNKYVITIDSQDYSCGSKLTKIYPWFIKFANERYNRKFPKDTQSMSLQVPYIEMVLRTKDAKKLAKSINNLYVLYYDGKKTEGNKLIYKDYKGRAALMPLTTTILIEKSLLKKPSSSYTILSSTNFFFDGPEETYKQLVSYGYKLTGLSVLMIAGDQYCSPDYTLPDSVRSVARLALNSKNLKLSMNQIYSQLIDLLS